MNEEWMKGREDVVLRLLIERCEQEQAKEYEVQTSEMRYALKNALNAWQIRRDERTKRDLEKTAGSCG